MIPAACCQPLTLNLKVYCLRASCEERERRGSLHSGAFTTRSAKQVGGRAHLASPRRIVRAEGWAVGRWNASEPSRRNNALVTAASEPLRRNGAVVTAAETSSEPNKILGIVITGGTKGVGYALTREFLGAGDRVVLCGRSEERVAAAIHALRAEFPGGEVYGMRCDVSNADDVAALAAAAKKHLGTVDRWINNAAHISEKRPLFEVDPKDLQAVCGTNVLGTILCCREAIRLMRHQQEGSSAVAVYHVFNCGFSQWGAALSSSVCTHKATKTGVAQLSVSLADELKKAKVTAIGIHNFSPGMVLTDLLLKGSSPVARRIFNVLAEEPETVAATLVPQVRQVVGANRSIEYLTLGGAFKRMLLGVPQIINGGRFFDAQGERVVKEGAAYKPNGVRLLYPKAATEEDFM